MRKIKLLPKDKLNEVAALIGESFWDYPYDKGEGGTFYSTDNGEGYILITDSDGSHPGFASVLKMMRGMKNAMGGWIRLLKFMKAAGVGGETLEQRMKNGKRRFVKVEMPIVTKDFQGQGYMRKLLEFAYKMADKKKAACILDTDAMGKCERYIHLGMKLEQTREAAGYKVYDLIREAK